MEDLEIFGENDPGHELRSGQTGGVQEEEGPVATSPGAQQPPKALPASSHLVGGLRETDRRSARNVVEEGPSQTGTENRGVSPHNLVDSL